MAGQGGHTRGILIEFWQHLPSVITPSMAMTEGERRRGLIPWFPSQFVFPAQNTDHTGSINTELRAARERESREYLLGESVITAGPGLPAPSLQERVASSQEII